MRYLVTARVKPGKEAALLRAIEGGTLPALLEEWCQERGIAYRVDETWRGRAGRVSTDPADYAFVASLGSKHSQVNGDECERHRR